MGHSRRTFLTAAGAALLLPGLKARGANDDIRVAIIGLGGKGMHHLELFRALSGVRVAAICDPDRAALAECAAKYGVSSEQSHTDLRRILDDKEIDAVVVATPNHWHALATVWACQAGKDVYVEKPCSHNIWEGHQMIAAARKHGRIVQVGTQRRSDQSMRELFEQLRQGELGKILRTRVVHYGKRESIGKVTQPQPAPPSVDYELWAGPAPKSPVMRQKFHYDWHWFWETGNGELGNNGPHCLDLARWVNGYGQLPPRVLSIGGRYAWDDNGQTPNTHVVFYDYPQAPIIAEIRNLPAQAGGSVSDQYKGTRAGLVIECENGYFVGADGGALYDNDGKKIRLIKGDNGRNHQANFVAAVRSRKTADLNCDIAEGHLSTALCHLGNVSHCLGAPASPEEIRHAIRSNPLTSEAFERTAAHLQANQIDLDARKAVLGPTLQLDPATERFTGDHADAANAYLEHEYRRPFVVPNLA